MKKIKFDSLTDLKKYLESFKNVKITAFNGYKLSTNLGDFGISGPIIYLDGKEFDTKTFPEVIKNLKPEKKTKVRKDAKG